MNPEPEASGDDGWSKTPFVIDGKEYLHRSGPLRRGSLCQGNDGAVSEWPFEDSGLLGVLLKPVEPEPRYPTPDEFIEPEALFRASHVDNMNGTCTSVVRRQLESEQHAVELLRDAKEALLDEDNRLTLEMVGRIRLFLRARDEGLPWPEGDADA